MKLAIVIPWFGRELKGGAEQLAWQLATRLSARGHDVDVLTTCCRSHQDDWATNYFPEAESNEPEGFLVRRFPVDARNRTAFDRVGAALLSIPLESLHPAVPPVDQADGEIFVNELIRSPSLIEFVKSKREAYDTFILLPYLYGPIIEAAMTLQNRAVLQPCLHNEVYAYLPQIMEAFYVVRKLLFNSEGEKELALKLFGPGIWTKSYVVGSGVETKPDESGSNGSEHFTPHNPFVLYLGRKDGGKNVPLLLEAFRRFKRVRPNSELKLVLAGHGKIDANRCDSIVDAGLVSEDEKRQLLKNCVALAQPSSNESFSRVMMEAWQYGRPVAVHSSCLATASAVRHCGGGWTAATDTEWAELFTTIDRMSAVELVEIGRRGLDYANGIADWNTVIRRYEELLQQSPPNPRRTEGLASTKSEIHQVLPNMSSGDAISNYALFIRNTLRAEGYSSEIYANDADVDVRAECLNYRRSRITDSAAIIYHHSIGNPLISKLIQHRGPKFLIYHNITPEFYVERYRPWFARLLRAGREELRELPLYFADSAGVSEFNRAELSHYGFRQPIVLPIAVDPARWQIEPDAQLMSQLQDGRTNILFVGRTVANKKQDDLIAAFKIYLLADPSARLILAGSSSDDDPYTFVLQELVIQENLTESVMLAGGVSDSQLAAYYRCAHLFWSMSEHEGFCVPLIEAMWFDIPVLAYKSSAIPETLGDAGLMFTSKEHLEEVAALAQLLVKPGRLGETLITAQRRRREAFLPAKVRPRILEIASRLERTHSPSSSLNSSSAVMSPRPTGHA